MENHNIQLSNNPLMFIRDVFVTNSLNNISDYYPVQAGDIFYDTFTRKVYINITGKNNNINDWLEINYKNTHNTKDLRLIIKKHKLKRRRIIRNQRQKQFRWRNRI